MALNDRLQNSAPLVYQKDITYLGAFRMPQLPATGNVCDGFSYGGSSLAFNPAGDSGNGTLVATAHPWCGYVGEFTIPPPASEPQVNALPIARLVNSLGPSRIGDPLEGALAASGIAGGASPSLTGLLITGDRLIIAAGNHYGWTQSISHWSRPLTLSVTGQVSHPTKVAGPAPYDNPRYSSGYMCHVPPELQSALGGPAITGWVPDSIVSTASNGPSAFAFEPARIGVSKSVNARPLLFYPHSAPLEASVIGGKQAVWNWNSMTQGCAIPNGTRSLLFVGRHGVGTFDYGVGGTSGYSTDTARRPIYDPADSSTGEHSWPYRYQVWAFDVGDLARANAGEIRPEQIRPYSVWTLSLPYTNPNGYHGVGGLAYDPKTRRMFVVQAEAGPFGEPAIHVFRVEQATAQQ